MGKSEIQKRRDHQDRWRGRIGYALAALHILNPNLDRLAQEQERERLRQQTEKKQSTEQTKGWMGYDDWNFT